MGLQADKNVNKLFNVIQDKYMGLIKGNQSENSLKNKTAECMLFW